MGVRQRRMLAEMATYGRCAWPRQWRLRGDHRSVLEALARKGLVEGDGPDAVLTADGRAWAWRLMSDAERAAAHRLGSPICVQAMEGV